MSLANKLTEERRRRLAAERLLELKQAELSAANRKLGKHAAELQGEIVETRAKVATVTSENARVRSQLGQANQKVELAEQRLWHSVQTISDGFAIFNSENRLLTANAMCGWLLHSNTYLIRFVHLSEAVMCPACLRGFDRWP